MKSEIVEILTKAYFERREIDKITDRFPLSIDEAYAVQKQVVERLNDRIIGYKMGLTSQAKMKQMGVSEPIYGVLTESMLLKSGSEFSISSRIHPKIEPEVAFVIGRPLSGAVSPAEALAACSGVCAAMEIIDSRFKNFNFTLPDVIADNCSSSAFVVGEIRKLPTELELGCLGMILEVDGKPQQFGSSAAIYGHPVASLVELCAMLSKTGRSLNPGDIVLAGAATAAISLEPNTSVRNLVQDLPTVTLKIIS